MPSGRLKRTSPSTLAQWVVDAWAAIPEGMVAALFSKCCILNELDGTEDDDLFECESNKEDSDGSASEDVQSLGLYVNKYLCAQISVHEYLVPALPNDMELFSFVSIAL